MGVGVCGGASVVPTHFETDLIYLVCLVWFGVVLVEWSCKERWEWETADQSRAELFRMELTRL